MISHPLVTLILMSLSSSILHAMPLIVAHRGASAVAPENTLPAFKLAWQQGADAIEGDFHLTRDNKIICIHNPTTGKYAKRNLTVRKSTLTQLRSLERQYPFPTLGEVLSTVPVGKKIYIEIKSSPKIVRHLLKEIDASDIPPEQLVIIAFSGRVIKKIKTHRPSLKAIWLTKARRRAKGSDLEPSPDEILSKIRRTGADGASIYAHPDIDADYLAPIHAAGYELHTWTIDDPEIAKKWIKLGSLSLTTNTPATLRSALNTDPEQ